MVFASADLQRGVRDGNSFLTTVLAGPQFSLAGEEDALAT
jgi:hypothetical protein